MEDSNQILYELRTLPTGQFGCGIQGGGKGIGERFVGGFTKAAEAALAVLIVGDGFEEMEAAEVWPEAVGYEDLGVGNLP